MKKAISILILVGFVLAMSASAVSAHYGTSVNQQNFADTHTKAKTVVVGNYLKAEAFGKEPVAAIGINTIAESYTSQGNVIVADNDLEFEW